MVVNTKEKRSLVWFRKGLRVHDNPALCDASDGAEAVFPVFVLDDNEPQKMGANRMSFLLESLSDLDANLKKLGSSLLCVRGKPEDVLPPLMRSLDVNFLAFEFDTEPYSKERDAKVITSASKMGIEVHSPVSHTLYDPEYLLAKALGSAPTTYSSFCKLISKCGNPPRPVAAPAPLSMPQIPKDVMEAHGGGSIPSLEDMGYATRAAADTTPFKGGETAGLARLEDQFKDTKWIALFEKPKTNPAALRKPDTTVLSPYLKYGCVSPRVFYFKLQEVYKKHTTHAQPPVSLLGQLYWREFFYLCGYAIPNFGRMKGNPICKQIPWDADADAMARLAAWREARTGYPWIDAAMTQLKQQGWLHHLARHSVACFLTRGDLWVSWEDGRAVFDELLIDADWSLNNANWMWLSCSSFFYQYFRCYSPVAFPKKYDANGDYVRHFIPALKRMPKKYIYEPWKAPLEVQRACGCIIGVDYPKPIVDHAVISKVNMGRMNKAYAANKAAQPPKKKAKKV